MNIEDYFRVSLLNLLRDKKRFIYIFVTLICVILCLGLFVFKANVDKIIDITLKKEIGYRTLSVSPRTEVSSIMIGKEQKFDIKRDIEELLNIEYVLDVYNGNYGMIVLTSDLANDKIDGTVTLLRGYPKTLPPIIEGRTFVDGEKGVAICPKYFYPNFDPLIMNKNDVIDGRKLLNNNFTVSYNDYVLDNFLKQQKNNTFTKTFKIVGIYDTSERMNDSGVCYISINDLIEISDTENSWLKNNVPALDIVVDDVKNLEYVINQVEELGFENMGLRAHLDMKMIQTIRLSIVIIFSLILSTIIVLTSSYVKKKINREEKTIGILRTSGYSKKAIKYLYVLEIFIANIVVFIFASVLFSIFYFLAIQNIKVLISANIILGGLILGVLSFIISFIVTVIIPCLVMMFYINKKSGQDIIKLIGSEE